MMRVAEQLSTRLAAAIAEVVREVVREEIAAVAKADPDEWIPHTKWPVTSRRVACELARRGEIPAKRAGKLWLARRRDLDAFVLRQIDAVVSKPPAEVVDFDAMRRAMGRRKR